MTDRLGRLVETLATDWVPVFAFNGAVSTPICRDGDVISTVDLWPNVLVRPDGVAYAVIDEDGFALRADGVPVPACSVLLFAGYWSGATLSIDPLTSIDAHARQC